MICISTNWLYKGRKIAILMTISVNLFSPLRSQKNEIGLLVGKNLYVKNSYQSNRKPYKKISRRYSSKQFKIPKARIVRAKF